MVQRAITFFLMLLGRKKREKWCIHTSDGVIECKNRPTQLMGIKWFILLILCGCTSHLTVTNYPSLKANLTVVEGNQAYINDICRRGADGEIKEGKWDDGAIIYNGQNIGGCYASWSNAIYILEGAPGCLWRHELCHASGRPASDCGEVTCEAR